MALEAVIQFNIMPYGSNANIETLRLPINKTYVAWWYGGLLANPANNTCPHVIVTFMEINDDGRVVPHTYQQSKLALTFLGQVRLGTLWRDKRCVGVIDMPSRTIKLNVNPGEYSVTSCESQPAFNQRFYPLEYRRDKNKLLQFDTKETKLLLPCMEYFSRCYGRSQEVKRIITTYPWDRESPNEGLNGEGSDDTMQRRMLRPLREDESEGVWKINLAPKLYNDDAVFVAHFKYDRLTQACAKEIRAELEVSYINSRRNNKKSLTFITARPWHSGTLDMLVEGIDIPSENAFLGLRIMGTSDPNDETIVRQRENQNDPQTQNPTGPLGGWPRTHKDITPPIKNLTDDERPDTDTETQELKEMAFVPQGHRRHVIHQPLDEAKTRGQDGPPRKEGDPLGSGDGEGRGKGIGKSTSSSPDALTSNGVVKDMWDTLNKIAMSNKYSPEITNVRWFVPGHPFDGSDSADIKLMQIDLPNEAQLEMYFDADNPNLTDIEIQDINAKRSAAINWCYIRKDRKDESKTRHRGLLVMTAAIGASNICIIEIERRFKVEVMISEDNDSSEKSELQTVESERNNFTCLSFLYTSDKQLETVANKIASNIGIHKGVFSRIRHIVPQDHSVDVHKPASWEEWSQEATIIRVFKKLGLSLSLNKDKQ